MYGILSLIGKKYGKEAMRRVLAITQQYPNDRFVRTVKNQGAPRSWYERGIEGNRGGISDSSRLGAAEGLLENASKYLGSDNTATPYSGIMSTLRGKMHNDKVTKDLINYYRANPNEYSKINEAGRTYWGEMGGEQYIDELAQNAIAQMAKRNFAQRGMTDYEKYMVTLARQRRQKAAEGAEIIQFPKGD